MLKCNNRRCGFYFYACMGEPSDCYCDNRMTSEQCQKTIKKHNLKDIKQLWRILNNIDEYGNHKDYDINIK